MSSAKRERFGAYSPERRTALVLTGTGAHGAYHAGVLRALQEAGVKIDVLAGHGIGAGGAALAAIDGSARLWEGNGIWRSPVLRRLYAWKNPFSPATWGTPRRRTQGRWWWRLLGAPLEAVRAKDLFIGTIWELIRGAAPVPQPDRNALGRRYSEALAENLGHPGFAELLLVATDLDARRDTVAALLREPYRTEFLAPRHERDRRAEVLDLSGIGRDHAVDVMAAAMTPPLLCDPELVAFAPDSYWRGETHRLCDRPGAIHRLLEETAAAGATQALVVSAVSAGGGPHRLRVPALDLRGRLGEFQSGAEAAALRDALEMARLRFDSVYVVTPAHNAVGPFDFGGAYDEASDRRQELAELMQRGYEDAYRQFIEPVVGASGEQLARVTPAPVPSYVGPDPVFDDPALPD